jgi:CBS domain-containing protein
MADDLGTFFTDLWADAGGDVVERFDQTGSPEWDMLAEHTVAEAMSRRVVTVGPDTTAAAAARLMTRLQIHRLLVVDQGKLCGVLSAMDLVRAVGQKRL